MQRKAGDLDKVAKKLGGPGGLNIDDLLKELDALRKKAKELDDLKKKLNGVDPNDLLKELDKLRKLLAARDKEIEELKKMIKKLEEQIGRMSIEL